MQKVSPLYMAMTPESDLALHQEAPKADVPKNGNYPFPEDTTQRETSSNINGNVRGQNFRLEKGRLIPDLRTPRGRLIKIVGWPEDNSPSERGG